MYRIYTLPYRTTRNVKMQQLRPKCLVLTRTADAVFISIDGTTASSCLKKKQQLTQKPSQVSISVFPFTLSLAPFQDLRPILSNLQKGITVDTNKFGHRKTNGIRNTYSRRKCTCSEVKKTTVLSEL